MIKGKWSKKVILMLGMAVFGTALGTAMLSVNSTAYADKIISFATYNKDIAALEKAIAAGSDGLRTELDANYITSMKMYPNHDYDEYSGDSRNPSFTDAMNMMAKFVTNDSDEDSAKDYNAMYILYTHFRNQFSTANRQKVDGYFSDSNQYHEGSIETAFSDAMQWDVDEVYVNTPYIVVANGVRTADPNAWGEYEVIKLSQGTSNKSASTSKKSSISKVTAKKTASKKYVKVTGTAKLYKKANYAHIKTYKGYCYAKLNSKHAFSKTIYAPKAKTVKVTVGYYANGHYKAVTSTKTLSVK